MKDLVEELKQGIIDTYKNSVDIDKPYLTIMGKESKIYSKRDICKELENETELGIKIMKNCILLSLDLFARGKEEMQV